MEKNNIINFKHNISFINVNSGFIFAFSFTSFSEIQMKSNALQHHYRGILTVERSSLLPIRIWNFNNPLLTPRLTPTFGILVTNLFVFFHLPFSYNLWCW